MGIKSHVTPKRTALTITVFSTILVFIASILTWYGSSQATHVPTGLLCKTAGYSKWDCAGINRTMTPACCVGDYLNTSEHSVPAAWYTELQGCGDIVDSLVQSLPQEWRDSQDSLVTDKYIQCEGYKATTSWFKYLGGVFAWITIFLCWATIIKPKKLPFRYSKYLAAVTIILAIVGLQMVLADANHLELFSFVYCQDYSIEQWQGRLNITGRPLYCSDTTITGFTQDNDLYWFLVLVFNCQQAGDCLIILACFFIIARPYVTREQMFNIQSTGPKGYVY